MDNNKNAMTDIKIDHMEDDEDFEEETEEDGDAEATEETACSTNASRQHDDRSAVLGFSPIKPPTDVSQVGSS